MDVGDVRVGRSRALWDSGVMEIRNARKGFDRINRILKNGVRPVYKF